MTNSGCPVASQNKRPCQKLAAPLSEFWLIGLSSLSDRGCFTQHSGEPYPCPFYSTPCQKKRTKKERSEYMRLWVFADKIRIPSSSRLSCLLSLSLSLSPIHIPKWSCISIPFTLLGGLMCLYACVSGSSRHFSMTQFTEQVSVIRSSCVCTSV